MKKYFILFLFLIARVGYSLPPSPVWPKGTRVETYQKGLLFKTTLSVDTENVSPKASARSASKGSLLTGDQGLFWKNDAGSSTNWLRLLSDSDILGTANQITVSSSSVAVTLSTPQNIHTAASPTFTGMTMSGLTASNFIKTDGAKTFVSASGVNLASEVSGILPVANGGSQNKLLNSSFEEAVAGQSWTSTSGTLTNVTAATIDGSKYAQVALTAQVLNFSQTTATSVSLVGLQAEASVYVMAPSTVNNLQLCAKVNSADTLTCSETFSGTDSWQLKAIPFVLGSTNNGLVLKTTGVATGNIAIDNARLIIGDVRNTSSVVTAWQTYIPTFTGFGTVTNIEMQFRQVGSNYEIRGKFTVGTNTATEARISLPNAFTSASSSVIPTIQIAGSMARHAASTSNNQVILIEPSVTYMTVGNYWFDGTRNPILKLLGSEHTNSATFSIYNVSIPIGELAGNVTTITQPLSDKETWYLSQLGSALTENSDDIRFALGGTITIYRGSDASTSTALINNSSGNMYALDEASGGQRTKFIANKNVTVTASWAAGINGASIIALNVNDARLIWGSEASSGSQMRMVSASFDLKPGEFFSASTQSGASVTAGANPVFLSFTSALKNPSITGNFANTMNTSSGFSEESIKVLYGDTATTVCSASPCAYMSQIGSRATSVTKSGATYALNLNKTFAKLMCSLTDTDGSASGGNVGECTNCSSIAIESRTTGPTATYGMFSCVGY